MNDLGELVAMGDIHKSSISLLEASQGIWGVGEFIVATSSATSSQVAELGTVSLTILDPAWPDAAFSTGSLLPGSLSKKSLCLTSWVLTHSQDSEPGCAGGIGVIVTLFLRISVSTLPEYPNRGLRDLAGELSSLLGPGECEDFG